MKTTMKKMALVLLISIAGTLSASAFEDSLRVNETKTFDLVLSDVSNSTSITLKDKRDNILFVEIIDKGESFKKTFNLELLPVGNYVVEIENATLIKVMNLEMNDEGLLVAATENRKIHKPVVSDKGNLVYLSQFSPEHKPLYVAIYNSRNELVHEEILQGRIDLGKIYDFSKTQGGSYRFYLESDGKSYDQLVYVER